MAAVGEQEGSSDLEGELASTPPKRSWRLIAASGCWAVDVLATFNWFGSGEPFLALLMRLRSFSAKLAAFRPRRVYCKFSGPIG
jgi:hypothetical protein